VDLDKDPLTDSDCFCLCCHSHHYTQLCIECQQIGCNRCFNFYHRISSACMFCALSHGYHIYFTKIHAIPENSTLSLE
jgi:hypothetical protein